MTRYIYTCTMFCTLKMIRYIYTCTCYTCTVLYQFLHCAWNKRYSTLILWQLVLTMGKVDIH